jgi:hypothetical protein
MSETDRETRRGWPFWKLVIWALPVGVAVAAFLAIRWPSDLLVVFLLVGLAAVFNRLQHGRLGQTLLLYAFLFLTLLTAIGAYLASSVRQEWLPTPGLVGLGVLSVLLGSSWCVLSRSRGGSNEEDPDPAGATSWIRTLGKTFGL